MARGNSTNRNAARFARFGLRLHPFWAHCSAHIAGVRPGRERGKNHATLKAALVAWFEVKKARWIKRRYATASIITADRILFNVKGNDYRHSRLFVAVDFEKSVVWIKWIGTHRDYEKIDVKVVQLR
jgi:mRNA interferase HigB